jgi:hypothetical protein
MMEIIIIQAKVTKSKFFMGKRIKLFSLLIDYQSFYSFLSSRNKQKEGLFFQQAKITYFLETNKFFSE